MLEDLKKIEESWREMDEFAAFSNKLRTLTFFVAKLCARSPPTPLPSTTTNGW
jgi:hypothetical protein